MKTPQKPKHRTYATAYSECLRLDPELRLCSQWDSVSIRKFPLASWHSVGWQVLDDFCLEHIM